jgi:hypothetical protein
VAPPALTSHEAHSNEGEDDSRSGRDDEPVGMPTGWLGLKGLGSSSDVFLLVGQCHPQA